MKIKIALLLVITCMRLAAQPLTNTLPDGRYSLSNSGATYFAKLSLECTNKPYPHDYRERLQKAEDLKAPDKMWPSFYGCFDWHSGVHNHWALVKLLKKYPKIPEAKAIREKLEKSFNADNIKVEAEYLRTHADEEFEYPYGQGWLLKVAVELQGWNDPDAKRWLKSLQPLADLIVKNFAEMLPRMQKPVYTGNHYATSLGLSFAHDYAVAMKVDSLKSLVELVGKVFYKPITKFPLEKEPFGYDFMSAGLLIADFMGRIMPQAEYEKWLKAFAPDLFTKDGIGKALKIEKLEKHDGYESHFDGFHLNRIWCVNSIFKYVSPGFVPADIKKLWVAAQNEMWTYAQESIGKGNYDVDHWLSSFSVYALEGNN
jgi:hypothetical protein